MTTEIESKQLAQMEQVEIEIADKAYEDLSQIFSNHFENAMQEAGKYLIKEFYGDDIELAREKKSPNKGSLNRLIERLQNRSADSPSKSWIYQSMGLVIQEKDMEKEGNEFFQTFGNLSLSHKLCLLPITDIGTKKELISTVVDKNLSVRQLEELKTEKQIPTDRKIGVLSLLNDPEKILNNDIYPVISLPSLKKETTVKLTTYKNKAQKKCDEFKEKLDDFKKEIEKHQKYIKEYEKLTSKIEKAIENRTPRKRGRKKKTIKS